MILNSILNINCFDGLKLIKDNSVQLIILDPPIGSFKNLIWDKVLDLQLLNIEFKRILKDTGIILFFASGKYVFEAYNLNNKNYKYDLIWKKSRGGSNITGKYMPLRLHENILVFGNSNSIYNPQFIDGKPYKRNIKTKKNNMGFNIKETDYVNEGKRFPNSILEFKQNWSPQQQLYPSEKPIELLRWLIRTYSNENDTVLDPTFGSGSSIISSIIENRNYIGFDLSKDAYDIAINRIDFYNIYKKDIHDKNE